MRDPYEVLGVGKTATAEEIRTAYRKLAKANHPDLHPGDAAAEARFKEISAANEILSDTDKRKQFDEGRIGASGAERPQREYYRDYGDAADGKYRRTEVYGDEADVESIFADLFAPGGGGRVRMRGPDVSYTMEVDLTDVATGARRTITTPDGRTLNVTIPVGLRDRQTLRLKGLGGPGIGGGEPGDAYVEIHLRSHPVFERKDDSIHVKLPVTLAEAVLGGKVPVPTVTGTVSLTIPPGSNTGTTLRLRGKGIPAHGDQPAGDQYVRLEVVLPKEPDESLKTFLAGWAPEHGYDPRGETMRMAGR